MTSVVRPPAGPGLAALLPAFAGAAAFAVLLLLVEAHWTPLRSLDHAVADRLHAVALRSAAWVLAMKAVSALGTSGAYLLCFAPVVTWLVRRRQVRRAVFVVVTVAGGSLLNSAVKRAVGRPRPAFAHPVAHAGFTSFPSGHAQGVVVACVVLLTVLPLGGRRWARRVAAGWVLLVGFSRLALGVHYLSDVVAGYALGLTWVLVLRAVFAGRLGVGGRGQSPAVSSADCSEPM